MTYSTSVRSEALYQHLKNFVTRSLDLLSSDLGDLGYEQRQCMVFTGGGCSIYMGCTPSFQTMVLIHKKEILELPEFGLCASAVGDDRSIDLNDVKKEDLLTEFLIRLLRRKEFFARDLGEYAHELGKRKNELLIYDEIGFEELYREYEECLYNSGKRFGIMASLRGFSSPAGRIELEESVTIRRLAGTDIQQLWNDHYDALSFVPAHEFSTIEWVIWIESKTPATPSQLDTVETALRLWKSGGVGYDAVYYLPVPGLSIYGHQIPLHPRALISGSRLVLDPEEVGDFILFYQTLKHLDASRFRNWDVAIRRFNDSYARNRRVDELLDQVIAFEALFSEGPADLRHKVPTRVARLLATDLDKRKLIQHVMKKAYDARSHIVHGNGHPSPADLTVNLVDGPRVYALTEFVTITQGYLRESLRAVMKEILSGSDKASFLERIDLKPDALPESGVG